MLPVSLDCPCLITPSVFSNVYSNTSFWKKVVHSKIDYLRLCLLAFFLGGGYTHIFSTNKTDPHDITMIWMTAVFSIKINNPNQHIAIFCHSNKTKQFNIHTVSQQHRVLSFEHIKQRKLVNN